MATVEFYADEKNPKLCATIWNEGEGAVPRKGERICIKSVDYTVVYVEWSVDTENSSLERKLRACVMLRKARP